MPRWTVPSVPTFGLKCPINSKYFWIENSWCTGRDLWLHHYVSTINSFVLLSGEGGFGYKIGWNLVIRSRKSENSRWVLESPHACIPGLGTMCEMLITALHRVTPDRHITLGTQLLQLILPWATWLASLDSKWANPGHCIQDETQLVNPYNENSSPTRGYFPTTAEYIPDKLSNFTIKYWMQINVNGMHYKYNGMMVFIAINNATEVKAAAISDIIYWENIPRSGPGDVAPPLSPARHNPSAASLICNQEFLSPEIRLIFGV